MTGFLNYRIEGRALTEAAARYRVTGPAFDRALTKTVNWVGDKARTKVIAHLAVTMGTSRKEVRNAMTTYGANGTSIIYTLRGIGRPLSLRAFGAVQRAKGVSARPWNERRLFRGTFIIESLGGSVYVRTGTKSRATKGRYKGKFREDIKKLWGPAVPREMATQVTFNAFRQVVNQEFPARLDREMVRALARMKP